MWVHLKLYVTVDTAVLRLCFSNIYILHVNLSSRGHDIAEILLKVELNTTTLTLMRVS